MVTYDEMCVGHATINANMLYRSNSPPIPLPAFQEQNLRFIIVMIDNLYFETFLNIG